MGEVSVDCEDKCVFFQALPTEEIDINRTARISIHSGKEFPGSLNTICGRCMKQKINDTALEEYTRKFVLSTAK